MLVLKRKENQSVTLRDPAGNLIAVVQVVELDSGCVRLGFIADPKGVIIARDELERPEPRRASA